MKKLQLLLCACAVAGAMSAETALFPVAYRSAATTSETAVPDDVHYSLPEGCFFFGDWASVDGYYFSACTSIIAPAHSTITFKNDGVEGDSYKWTYCDPTVYKYSMSNFTYLTSETRDLTYESECYNYTKVPTLATTIDGSSFEYALPPYSDGRMSFLQYGGRPGDFLYNNYPGMYESGFFGFMQYDFRVSYVVLRTNYSEQSYVLGKGDETKDKGVTGLVTMFHKPAAPYVLKDGLKANVAVNCDDDAELTVTLRKATKVSDTEYELGAEIGHATLTGSEIKTIMSKYAINDDYVGWLTVADFVMTDEEGEEASVLPATIDSALAVVFTGWDSAKFSKFEIFTNEQIVDEAGEYDTVANSRIETSTFWTGGDFGTNAKAPYEHFVGAVTLGAFFPILNVDAESCEVPVEGGTQSFKVDRYQYYSFDTFNATTDADWITQLGTSYSMGTRNYGGTLSFTVEANEGAARSAVIVLSDSDGSRTEFVVNQAGSTTGVNGVSAVNVKTFVAGNELVVRGAAGNVSIFNAAGSLVKNANVSDDATISIENLASGVYFVRFANGTTTRFVK